MKKTHWLSVVSFLINGVGTLLTMLAENKELKNTVREEVTKQREEEHSKEKES